jgi:outer membrane protein assembly factor BamB
MAHLRFNLAIGLVCIVFISVLLVPARARAQYPEIMWWYDLDAPSFGSAAVGDIDKDGCPEIVFGTYFNDEHVYALNGDDGTLLWRFNTGGCNDASPAIADVDLDGDLEVVVPASSPYRVYCLAGSTGTVEWQRSTGYPNCIDSPPAVEDVDNDGRPEVILGTWYGHVFCLNGEDGTVEWRADLGNSSYIQAGPNILDVDADDQLDVVVAQYAGACRVYALRGDSGSVIWYSDVPTDYMYHGGSFADVDEDGKPEIAIGCYDARVYLLNAEDGSLEWDFPAPFYVGAPTSIADLNNDDHLEVVYAAHSKVGVLSRLGGKIWDCNAGGSVFRGAAISDIDGDDVLDLVFGSADGTLRARRGNDGAVIWNLNLELHYGKTYDMDHAPVIADFDGDGLLDVFVVGGYAISDPDTANHGRAYAVRAGEGTGPDWLMFRHDLRHSACVGEDVSGVDPEPFDAGGVRLEAHPNPFTSEVVIRYFAASAGRVRLRVYDVTGRLVRTLAAGRQEPGWQSVVWGGADDTSCKLPSGIYFLRLDAHGTSTCRKILLIR